MGVGVPEAIHRTKRNNRSKGSHVLSSCKGIIGLELRGELTSSEQGEDVNILLTARLEQQIYNPPVKLLEKGTQEPQAIPVTMEQ